MKPRGNSAGLTLIELLVVIALVGIVAAIALPVLLNTVTKAQTKADTTSAAELAAFTNWSAGYSIADVGGHRIAYEDTNGNGTYDADGTEEIVAQIRIGGAPATTTGPPAATASWAVSDSVVRDAIRASLGLPGDHALTGADAQNLTELALDDVSADVSLNGLQWATNLTRIYATSGAGVRPASPAQVTLGDAVRAPNLAAIEIYYLRVADLSGLVHSTQLTELALYGTQSSNISSISNLSNLAQLTLVNLPVTDLSPLSGMDSLVWLNLVGSSASDASPLSGLTRLGTLMTGGSNLSTSSLNALQAQLPGLHIDRAYIEY